MIFVNNKVKTFISSCRDVKIERKMVLSVIDEVNKSVRETIGLELQAEAWEDYSGANYNIPEGTIQDFLNKLIEECNIVIIILYKRWGTKENKKQKLSNFEREINTAIDVLNTKKKITLLPYFRNLGPNEDQGTQEKKVRLLRNRLERENIFYTPYENPEDFKEKVTHHLYRTLLRIRLSTNKSRALNKFWTLGLPDRRTHPQIAIVYPPINRAYMGEARNVNVWLNRLQPNMVFEDFKALQKIEKTLRIINFRSYRIFNVMSVLSDIHFMNTFWICIPRNRRALDRLKLYEKICKFKFFPKNQRSTTYLEWKTNPRSKKKVVIRSPLSKYLNLQRFQFNKNSDWQSEMSNIIAKDYAVLARFNKVDASVALEKGILKEYFLAGIRGLGTWGAGWFIDRCYDYFHKISDDEEIQLLLEVTYNQDRILNVDIVSNKSQSYFNNENNEKTIKKHIEKFKACDL